MITEGVSMDEDLSYEGTLFISSLKFLRHNVLTLRKFEDVLNPVDDLKLVPRLNQHANISSVEPAIRVHCFSCEIRVSKVTFEYARSPQ